MNMTVFACVGVVASVVTVCADTGSFSATLQPPASGSVTLDNPSGVSTQTIFTVLSAAGSEVLRAWTEDKVSDYGGNEDFGLQLNDATVTAEDVNGRTKITFAGGESFSRKLTLSGNADLVLDGGVFTNALSFAAGPAESYHGAVQTITVKGGAKAQLRSRYNNFPATWGNTARLTIENGGKVELAHPGVMSNGSIGYDFRVGSTPGSTGIVEVAAGATLTTHAWATFNYPAGSATENALSHANFGVMMFLGGFDDNTSRNQHGTGILNIHGTAALASGLRLCSPASEVNVYSGGKLNPAANSQCEIRSGTVNFYEGSDSDIREMKLGYESTGGTGILNIYGGTCRVIGSPEASRGLNMPASNNAKSRAEINLLGGNFETRRLAPRVANNVASGGKGWVRVVADGGSVSPFFSGIYPADSGHDPHTNLVFISKLDEAILGPKGLTVNVNGRHFYNGVWKSVNWPIGTDQDFTNLIDPETSEETEGRLIITGDAAGEFYYNSLVSHHAVTELKGGTTFITNGANTASQKLVISGGRLALSGTYGMVQGGYDTVTVKDLVLGGANGAATIITDGTGSLTATDSLVIDSLNIVYCGEGAMDPETVYGVVRVAGDHAEELLPKVMGAAVTAGLPAGKAAKFTAVYADGYTTVKVQAVEPVAAAQTWAGTTTSWNAAENWTPAETPGIFSELLFPGSAAVKAITIAHGGTAGSLAFDSSDGYTITGEKLTLVGTDAAEAKPVTVTQGNHVIASPVRATGPVAATVASGSTLTLSGEVDLHSVVKDGAGTLIVTNTGLTTAGFTVKDGRFVCGCDSFGKTALSLDVCTNSTLEIVNDTGVEQTFPHTLNFRTSTIADQFVDLVIDGDVRMPAFNKGSGCWFKRGPGKLTLTGCNKLMFTGQRGYKYGTIHHVDADGRLTIADNGHGNVEIIEGTVHMIGNGSSIGGGSSMNVMVGGHTDRHTTTNVTLIVENAKLAPTMFMVGINNFTNEWGTTRRHIRVDLRDHSEVGEWKAGNYGSFYGFGQCVGGANDVASPIDIEVNYTGASKSGGGNLELSKSHESSSQVTITLDEASQLLYEMVSGYGNATVNLRGASEIRRDTKHNNVTGLDSAAEFRFFKEGGHYPHSWSKFTFNVGGRSVIRTKDVTLARGDSLKSWTAEPGVLAFNFDDGIWKFGEASAVEVTVRCPMRKNVKINALAGGLEFQVPEGQTVVFNKDVSGPGGVKKTGAGRFEFGLNRIVGNFTVSGNNITACETNLLTGADAYTMQTTGAVEVVEGTLAIREGAADPAVAKVVVASGATLDLTGGTHTLAGVGGAGTVVNGTLVDSTIIVDKANPSAAPTFAADAALTGTVKVDLGYTTENPISEYPKNLLVARYQGSAPDCSFKMVGGGVPGVRGTFTVRDGEIRASVFNSGLMLIIR